MRVSRKHNIAMIAPSMKVLYPYPTGGAFPEIEKELGRPLTEVEKEALSTGGEHGAVMETSFMLAYKPELVDDSYKECKMDGPPCVPSIAGIGTVLSAPMKILGMKGAAEKVNLVFDNLARNVGWMLNAKNGYGGHQVTHLGNPSAASVELGRALRKLIALDLLTEIDAVIEGRTRPEDVHSLYWQIPLTRTNFFRNLGIFSIALIVIILILIVSLTGG